MAGTLERMLEPGEAVVWRDQRTRAGLYALLGGFALPVLAGLVALAALGTGNDLFLVGSVMLCLWIVMGVATAMLVVDNPTETLVTNRRALLRRRSKFDDGFDDTALRLDQVTAVTLRRQGLDLLVQITCRNGAAHRIGDLRDRDGFLAALGRAGELPRPASIGRLERLNLYGAIFGYGTGVVLLYPLAITRRDSVLPGALWLDSPVTYLILFALMAAAVLVFGFWLGRHLAALLTVLLMPHFATAEEAQNWFDIEAGSRLARRSVWKHPLYFRLASWRYGRTISRNGMAGTGDGA